MKFLHTADWQIGLRATMLGEKGVRVRDARLESALPTDAGWNWRAGWYR